MGFLVFSRFPGSPLYISMKRTRGMNISRSLMGHPVSKEARLKMSLSHTGLMGFWNGKKRPLMENNKNCNWKGNMAGYRAIHYWVQRRLGKAIKCSINQLHKASRYHWANISGEYKRDLSDWKELCPKCNKNDGITMYRRFKRRRGI